MIKLRKLQHFQWIIRLLVPAGLSMSAGCGPDVHETSFLVSWSPDESRVAIVPDFLNDEVESGIWVFDSRTGKTTQIVLSAEHTVCVHPQWSPLGDRLLFATVEDDSDDDDAPHQYSIYVVNPDGLALSEVVRSTTSDGTAFLSRNALMWGPAPGTVVFQREVDGKVTAELLDLTTGQSEPYLPHGADVYSLEPSPDGRMVAVLLYDNDTASGEIYVARSDALNWHIIGTFGISRNRVEMAQRLIFWSPDSTRIAIPELTIDEQEITKESSYIRVTDVRTGESLRMQANSASAIFWSENGDSLLFSEAVEEGRTAILRFDLTSGERRVIVSGEDDELLTLNREDGRMYFWRSGVWTTSSTSRKRIQERRLFACHEDGTAARTFGLFDIGEDPSWNVSPAGNRIVIFNDATSGGVVNLTTGETLRLSLERAGDDK